MGEWGTLTALFALFLGAVFGFFGGKVITEKRIKKEQERLKGVKV